MMVKLWNSMYYLLDVNINYKYVLYQNIENEIIQDDYVNENTKIFEIYHMLN
jgi:hypothetical protein